MPLAPPPCCCLYGWTGEGCSVGEPAPCFAAAAADVGLMRSLCGLGERRSDDEKPERISRESIGGGGGEGEPLARGVPRKGWGDGGLGEGVLRAGTVVAAAVAAWRARLATSAYDAVDCVTIVWSPC